MPLNSVVLTSVSIPSSLHLFSIIVRHFDANCQKIHSNYHLFLRRLAKFVEDRTIPRRVIVYFRFSKWRTSDIFGFIFSHFFCQKFILAPTSRLISRKWWRSDDPRLSYCVFSIFKMASWMSCDVIADHPRLVFQILINWYIHSPKLHLDRVNTSQDIAIVIFCPFGLKLPIHASLESFGAGALTLKWIPILTQPPKGPSLGDNIIWAVNREIYPRVHGCVPEKQNTIP